MCRRRTRRILRRDWVFFHEQKVLIFKESNQCFWNPIIAIRFAISFPFHVAIRTARLVLFLPLPMIFCKNHRGLYFICVWDLFPLLRQGPPKDPSSLKSWPILLQGLRFVISFIFWHFETKYFLFVGKFVFVSDWKAPFWNTKQQQTARHSKKTIRNRPLPQKKQIGEGWGVVRWTRPKKRGNG